MDPLHEAQFPPAPDRDDPVAARAWIEACARIYGFTRVGVATAGRPAHPERYDQFLAEGRHAGMSWLAETRDQRLDPSIDLPGVRSAVVLGTDYGGHAPLDPGGLVGRVSRYAWGRDYHNLVNKRLRRLRSRIQTAWPGVRSWVGVDAAPAWERAWAEQAGVGYAGKNACIIAPADTSWFFLGLLFVTVDLPADAPVRDHCGPCRRCLDLCPTGALVGPGQLDANLCISYLTIEHEGAIPEALRPAMGSWVFGCDVCQEVCPQVRDRGRTRSVEPDLAPRNAWLDLAWVLAAGDEALTAWATGSPLRRAAPHKLKRNACVVLGNRGDRAAVPILEAAWRGGDALLREHAGWALDRLR